MVFTIVNIKPENSTAYTAAYLIRILKAILLLKMNSSRNNSEIIPEYRYVLFPASRRVAGFIPVVIIFIVSNIFAVISF